MQNFAEETNTKQIRKNTNKIHEEYEKQVFFCIFNYEKIQNEI